MGFDFQAALGKLHDRSDLAAEESRAVFEVLLQGQLTELQMAELLRALAAKGESVDELVGAARAMRAGAIRVRCAADCIDTCGTGGDGVSTFNVSTAAAIIAAAAGATVAKHGNRSTTRASGSTEVLTELGIHVEAEVATVERCLRDAGIGYLNARRLHPAMKHAAPVRQALPHRTIFNLLGPLTNPAGAKRQLLGVPKSALVEIMAQALLQLGATHAWVVHGCGLCDVTITGETIVAEVRHGAIRTFHVAPEDVGLGRAEVSALMVQSPSHSAAVIRSILDGSEGPPRDHALMNAGAALVVAGIANQLAEGVELARQAIDSGSARAKLKLWGDLSRSR